MSDAADAPAPAQAVDNGDADESGSGAARSDASGEYGSDDDGAEYGDDDGGDDYADYYELPDEVDVHTLVDRERQERAHALEMANAYLPDALDTLDLKLLTESQSTALRYVFERARTASEKALPALVARAKVMRFSEAEVTKALHYIRDRVPIVIHFNVERDIQYFLKDTHYRSMFEVNMSGIGDSEDSRVQWERTLFGSAYDTCSPRERVKYGVLNVLNSPEGQSNCYSYGDSYMVLKGVRLRTTFASQDSAGYSEDLHLASCEFYAHVANEYSDAELVALLDVGSGRAKNRPSSLIANYKEVQLHGPVEFSRNVERVVLNDRLIGSPLVGKVNAWAERCGGFPVHFMCDEWDPETKTFTENERRKAASKPARRR